MALSADVTQDGSASARHWQYLSQSNLKICSSFQVNGPGLPALAGQLAEIIDGTFTGYSGSLPRLQIAVIRSSEWIVWTQDETVVSRVRGGFRGVTDYDEPEPPPLEIP
jgi:hypothetical protein